MTRFGRTMSSQIESTAWGAPCNIQGNFEMRTSNNFLKATQNGNMPDMKIFFQNSKCFTLLLNCFLLVVLIRPALATSVVAIRLNDEVIVGADSKRVILTEDGQNIVAEELTCKILKGNIGGPGGTGSFLMLPLNGRFSDGVLGPKESSSIPFVMCVTKRTSVNLTVTALGDLKGRTKSNESDKTSRACVSRCHR